MADELPPLTDRLKMSPTVVAESQSSEASSSPALDDLAEARAILEKLEAEELRDDMATQRLKDKDLKAKILHLQNNAVAALLGPLQEQTRAARVMEITTLANLLHSVCEDDGDYQYTVEYRNAKMEKILPHDPELIFSNDDPLRERFLDRLAELLAREEGAKCETCVAMYEDPVLVKVDIYIVRRSGFENKGNAKTKELGFCSELSTILSKLCLKTFCKENNVPDSNELESLEDVGQDLWNMMTTYYAAHLQAFRKSLAHILKSSKRQINICFKKPSTTLSGPQAVTQKLLRELHEICFKPGPTSGKDMESLVRKAFEFKTDSTAKGDLGALLDNAALAGDIYACIRNLARIRAAHGTFVKMATTSPEFSKIDFIPIPSMKPVAALPRPTSFGKLGESAELSIPEMVITGLTLRGSGRAKMDKEFGKLQVRSLEAPVHAEVQMVCHMLKKRVKHVFPYIGSSSASCLLCSSIVEGTQYFGARRGYRDLDTWWTMPQLGDLPYCDARTILLVLEDLKHCLIARLTLPEPEEDLDALHNYLADRRMKECEAVSEGLRAMIHQYARPGACLQHNSATARALRIPALAAGKGSTGERLMVAMSNNVVPTDMDVLLDFGLFNVHAKRDQLRLMDLYAGMVCAGVRMEDLDKWVSENTLCENIIKTYSRMPRGPSSAAYVWFLQHRYILTFTPDIPGALDERLDAFLETARFVLTPEDRQITVSQLRPPAKSVGFMMFGLMYLLFRPIASELDGPFFDLGFSVCATTLSELRLTALYQNLLAPNETTMKWVREDIGQDFDSTPCTFEEFWKALENGTLIQLFDSHGFETQRKRIVYLDQFLKYRGGAQRPTVWRLYAGLLEGVTSQPPRCGAVAMDYGFNNCTNEKQVRDLKEVYAAVMMRGDPFRLNEACMTNTLYEYCKTVTILKPKMRRFMQNNTAAGQDCRRFCP